MQISCTMNCQGTVCSKYSTWLLYLLVTLSSYNICTTLIVVLYMFTYLHIHSTIKLQVYHCNTTGKKPDVPSTTSILMNLKAFPMIEVRYINGYSIYCVCTYNGLTFTIHFGSKLVTHGHVIRDIKVVVFMILLMHCFYCINKFQLPLYIS